MQEMAQAGGRGRRDAEAKALIIHHFCVNRAQCLLRQAIGCCSSITDIDNRSTHFFVYVASLKYLRDREEKATANVCTHRVM